MHALQWGRNLSVAEGLRPRADGVSCKRFNGAATFRLRKAPPTDTEARNSRLQWGRNLSVAEGCHRSRVDSTMKLSFNGAATFRLRKAAAPLPPPPSAVVASMGPQPFGCGRGGRKRSSAGMASFNGAATFRLRKAVRLPRFWRLPRRLQWGRNLSVAEGRGAAPHMACRARFNGAATFRLRKAGNDLERRRAMRASMGPQPFGCGRPDRVQPPLPPPPASMGPQPFGCGRIRLAPQAHEKVPMLQWGRNLSVAEGVGRKPKVLKDVELQWGRNLSVAEGNKNRKRCRGCCWASMGPQPFGCGRRALSRCLSSLSRLQWGRNLSVAEGPRRLDGRADRGLASMGPQPFGCGR